MKIFIKCKQQFLRNSVANKQTQFHIHNKWEYMFSYLIVCTTNIDKELRGQTLKKVSIRVFINQIIILIGNQIIRFLENLSIYSSNQNNTSFDMSTQNYLILGKYFYYPTIVKKNYDNRLKLQCNKSMNIMKPK